MRKVLKIVVVAAAATALLGWAGEASATKIHKQVRYVRTVGSNGFYVDNDPSGNSGGDLFGSTGDLRHGGRKAGTFSSACTASSAEHAQCQATFIWNSGHRIQLAGDFEIQSDENHLAIVGGTGKYKKARGDATLKLGSQDGSVQRVRLRILR